MWGGWALLAMSVCRGAVVFFGVLRVGGGNEEEREGEERCGGWSNCNLVKHEEMLS